MKKKSIFLSLGGLFARHTATLIYVLTVLLPIILRTGRRPVIFSRFSGLGDVICSIPAAQELKKRHPGAIFIFNCHADFVDIPRLTQITNKVTSFKYMGLVNHWYSFLLAKFYEFLHGDPVNGGTFMEQYSRQFSLPPTDQHPGFTPDAAMQGGIRKILNRKNMGEGPFIVIHTGPSDPIREWPHEKWTELVELLHKNGYADIVQIGVSRHASFGKIAVDQLHGTVSLLDELTLEETLGVISLARLYIGIDSGPLHLAAMARIPAVGIFGAITPQLRFSKDYCSHFVVSRLECQGCGHYPTPTHYSKDCPFHIRCMKEIGVEEVLQACLEKLKLSGR